eukprot:gene528-666_t
MGQNLSSQQQFPYVIGNPVTTYSGKSIWTLHSGTKKEDNHPVSIFSFDIKKNPGKLEVAKNGFKRAKTIRHPNFLTYLDGVELESNIYIVTELVQPLEDCMEDINKYEHAVSWGVYQITKALAFLNNDCNLTHGNVNPSTIFVTKGGDWKLGGLDLVSDLRNENSLLKSNIDLVAQKYRTPEIAKGQWSQLSTSPAYATDSWAIGCLLFECHGGQLTKTEDVKNLANIPKPVHPQYQKCFSSKPESRLNPQKVLESPYFQNFFVETCNFLENITLKDNFEKESFFKKLDHNIDKIPVNICKFKILPHLITAFDFGPVNPKILGTLLKISSNLSSEEYTTKVIPSVVKWFASDDRALRINLLENLEHFISHLSADLINNQIFPNVVNGFNDNPALKELTIKSMLSFAPKLSEKTMIQLLKYFAALQKDMQPGIRTNTTICLGRIAEYLSESTKKRVLIPAFSTALKDPFVPSQNAGLSAFMFTINNYTAEEIATRIIPEISRCLISIDKGIRTTSIQALNLFIQRIEKLLESMEGSPTGDASATGTAVSTISSYMPQVGQDSMLGWAVGFTKKLYTGNEQQPNSNPNNSNMNSQQQKHLNTSSPSPPTQHHQSAAVQKQFHTQQMQKSYNTNSNSSNSNTNINNNNNNNVKVSKKVIQDGGWGDDNLDLDLDDEPEVSSKNKFSNNNNYSSKSKYNVEDDDEEEEEEDDDDNYSSKNNNKKYNQDLPSMYSKPKTPSSSTSSPLSSSGGIEKKTTTMAVSSSNTMSSSNNNNSTASTTNKGKGMQLVSKKPQTTKLTKFSFDDDDDNNWGDSVSDSPKTNAPTSTTKTTISKTTKIDTSSGWGDWEDDI